MKQSAREVGVPPGRARWASAAVFALAATAAACWPAWPGQMNFDSLHAYETSITGIKNVVWPPSHAYLFWISRQLGLGTGGLFAFQVFAVFFGAAFSLGLLVRGGRSYAAGLIAFAGSFVLIPPLLGVVQVHWRDVLVASFAALGFAAWMLAARRESAPLLIASALAVGAAASLRYNAFPLFVLWIPLMIWRPFLGNPAGPRTRAVAAIALAVGLGLAWASTQWRLPDLQRMRPPGTWNTIHLFDLLGVSACEGRSFVPLAITRGEPMSGDQVRRVYDRRHLQLAFGPHPGAPLLYAVQKHSTKSGNAATDAAWRAVVPTHLRCYLHHRNGVFLEQLGMAPGEVFYPTHGALDDNRFGIRFAHPAAAKAFSDWVIRGSAAWWRRPAWLFLGAALVTVGLMSRSDRRAPLALVLLGGAVANAALLYVIGPAADARYIFPSDVFCALLIAVGLAVLVEPRRQGGSGRVA